MQSAGTIEMSEQVPGPVTFTWIVQIDKTSKNSWNSPSFKLLERSGIGYEWEMIFGTESCQEFSHEKHDRLEVRYCGKVTQEKSKFVMNFCVHRLLSTNDKVKGEQCVKCYDNTTDENVPHDFFVSGSYKIVIPRIVETVFKLKVLCTIAVAFDNIEQNGFLLTLHEISLRKEYLSLFESGKFSDVTFIVGKQKMQLHKSILSSRSNVLAAMFDNGFKESNSNEVEIEDHSFEAMKEFFRYVYAAKVNDIGEHAVELLMLSNKYEVGGLKSLCEQSLIKSLENVNVLDCLNLANLHNAKILELKCVNFIASNASEIIELPDFSINKVPEDLRDKLFNLVVRKS
ncbi:hypothetical protein QAD02_016601 [Eretmocerus hayati]|uniref:Uncharacterized protein n=1 Tax=Eretmocerus hayati TaxID=131215 RepID=A0ACC2PB40_9HYME|nr:hypothetical protein QAD02_016601 [Eretmocerus hayati]